MLRRFFSVVFSVELFFRLAWFALAVVATSGCESLTTPYGATWCEGSVLHETESSGSAHAVGSLGPSESTTDCAALTGTCVEAGAAAACVATDAATCVVGELRCTSDGRAVQECADEVGRFAAERDECGADEQCVQVGTEAACVRAPLEACEVGAEDACAADGGAIVRCELGYRATATSCGDVETCAVDGSGHPWCVAAPATPCDRADAEHCSTDDAQSPCGPCSEWRPVPRM